MALGPPFVQEIIPAASADWVMYCSVHKQCSLPSKFKWLSKFLEEKTLYFLKKRIIKIHIDLNRITAKQMGSLENKP